MFEHPPAAPPRAQTSAAGSGQGSTCAICGWNFEHDNARRIVYDPENPNRWRKDPRTEIRIRDDAFCDVCYELGLWRRERHTAQGACNAGIYRDALLAARDGQEKLKRSEHVPRPGLAKQLDQLLTKIEVTP